MIIKKDLIKSCMGNKLKGQVHAVGDGRRKYGNGNN